MAKIIIVVTETAVGSEFGQTILDIHLKGRLDRIVFDEIHKLITDLNFRPKLEQLNQLALPVPYLFLTATFPPSLIDKFNNSMLIENPTFIRTINQKPRVRYNVRRMEGENTFCQTYSLIERMVECCGEMEKVLVFCCSREQCDRWAEMFGCGV
jgi:superfamily II DNA helicase RecQ